MTEWLSKKILKNTHFFIYFIYTVYIKCSLCPCWDNNVSSKVNWGPLDSILWLEQRHQDGVLWLEFSDWHGLGLKQIINKSSQASDLVGISPGNVCFLGKMHGVKRYKLSPFYPRGIKDFLPEFLSTYIQSSHIHCTSSEMTADFTYLPCKVPWGSSLGTKNSNSTGFGTKQAGMTAAAQGKAAWYSADSSPGRMVTPPPQQSKATKSWGSSMLNLQPPQRTEESLVLVRNLSIIKCQLLILRTKDLQARSKLIRGRHMAELMVLCGTPRTF